MTLDPQSSLATIAALEARVRDLEKALEAAGERLAQQGLLLDQLRSASATGGSQTAASRWSSAGFPLLQRGDTIACADEEAQAFLASGWWGVEHWGVWGRGNEQIVRFHLDHHIGGYEEVRLTLQGFQPTGEEPVSVTITANGYFIGDLMIGALPRVYKLRLPPSSIHNGDVALYLRSDMLRSPADTVESADTRPLGIGILALARQ
jgi:hypothetical protein